MGLSNAQLDGANWRFKPGYRPTSQTGLGPGENGNGVVRRQNLPVCRRLGEPLALRQLDEEIALRTARGDGIGQAEFAGRIKHIRGEQGPTSPRQGQVGGGQDIKGAVGEAIGASEQIGRAHV